MLLCDDCCGACCRFVSMTVPRMTPDQERWAAMHGTVKGVNWRIRSRCSKLDHDGKCSIYKSRPQVCAEYKQGGPQCLAAREQAKKEGWM